jgi:hypothetical protein
LCHDEKTVTIVDLSGRCDMQWLAAASLTLATLLLICSCGSAPTPAAAGDPSAPGPAVAGQPSGGPEPGAGSGAGGGDDGHVCRRSIDRPSEVWDRIEAVRALPEPEREAECTLRLVEILARWRVAPIDLVEPIVARAASDRAALVAWVRQRESSNSAAAAHVVAMDVVRGWKIGGDPASTIGRAEEWRRALSAGGKAPSAAVTKVLDAAGELPGLLERVTEIHRLRCLLEINPLGFAVKCVPIHPSGRPIALSWRTTTRDGLVEELEVTACKGPSCKKIRKTAAKLLKQLKALLAEVEQLESEVYRDQIKIWLVLPPFKSISA